MHDKTASLCCRGSTVPSDPITGLWEPSRGVFLIDDRRFPLTPEQLATRKRYDELVFKAPPIVKVERRWPRWIKRVMRAALASGFVR